MIKRLPLKMVGGTRYGVNPYVSSEETYNMYISDDSLIPIAGHKNIRTVISNGIGRDIYTSKKYNHMIAVVDNQVYSIDKNLASARIAEIDSFSGDIFIAENNASQIAISDQNNIYIYDYANNTFSKATIPFDPGYITFQNTFFIATVRNKPEWRLSAPNNGFSWPTGNIGEFQTKPDTTVAAVPLPGKGNNLLVMGETVSEFWVNVGAPIFPYKKNTNINLDYGCLSAPTIAYQDEMVCFLAGSDKAGPAIMVSTGGAPQRLSNDGIDRKLEQLKNPAKSYGFFVRQNGHLLYIVTFVDDNLSYAYDFNTKEFFSLCDTDMTYYPAKRIVSFNNSYFFVSLKDGNLYELNSKYTDFDGKEFIRARITPTLMLPTSEQFYIDSLTFPVQQGTTNETQRIDMSISKNGGVSYSNYLTKNLRTTPNRASIFKHYRMGKANQFTAQFRFWGKDSYVIKNGVLEVNQ